MAMRLAFFVAVLMCLSPAVPAINVLFPHASAAPVAAAADDWTMFHHDAKHSGFSTSTAPDTNNLPWKRVLDSGLTSSPVVAGGKVFIGTDMGTLYCADAVSGKVSWSYPTGRGIIAAPAVDSGKVYFGSVSGKIYALDTATENQVWNFTTKGMVRSAPTVSGGKIFAGSDDGKLYAIDAATGLQSWNYTIGGEVRSSPAVADGKVFAASTNGKLMALAVANGAYQWNFTSKTTIRTSPSVDGTSIYIGTDSGIVYSLDTANGAIRWMNYTSGSIASSPAVAYGNVFAGSDDSYIYAFDKTSGKLSWKAKTGDVVESSPAVADNKVYAGSKDGKVYAFSVANGAMLWNYTVGRSSSPAVADGKLFVASADHNLYCFGPGYPMLLVACKAPASIIGGRTAQIEVDVTSSATGLAVKDALVELSSDNGGSFTPSASGMTDSSGKFITGFTAPNTQVVVRITANASLSGYNDDTTFADITVTPLPKLAVNISAVPQTIQSGGTSVLTIHVTNYSSGFPIPGAYIELNASEGNFTVPGGFTEPTGDFNTVYQSTFTSVSKNITVNATATGDGFQTGLGQITITQRPKLNITLIANTSVIVEKSKALITIMVTDYGANPLPVANAIVKLSTSQGTISPRTGLTNALGILNATFIAPGTGGQQQVICQIIANVTKKDFIGDQKSMDISVVNKNKSLLSVSVIVNPDTIPNGGSTGISVTVRDSSNNTEYVDATINVTSDMGGTFVDFNKIGTGRYTYTFNAPVVAKNTVITITATAENSKYDVKGKSTDTVTVTTSHPENLTVSVVAFPTTIDTTGAADLIINVQGEKGEKISGATLTLTCAPDTGTLVPPVENATSAGEYSSKFNPPAYVSAATNFVITAVAHKLNFNDGANNRTVIKVTALPNKPPKCNITDPQEGATLSGTYLITGNASDPDNGLARIEVQITTSSTPQDGKWLNVTGLGQWTYSWDTTSLSNGGYKIFARSYDGLAYSQVSTVNVTVNNGGTSSNGKIPGFETAVMLGSIGVAFLIATVLYSRRKKD